MSLENILAFVKENPVCIVATTEGDQPHVRAFLSVIFDDNCIYFTTASTKSVFKQIASNPKVELCYCSQDYSRMMRLTGKFEIVDDRQKKQTLIDERDYLKPWKGKADDPVFILLRISHGAARFWSLENNMKENEIQEIVF